MSWQGILSWLFSWFVFLGLPAVELYHHFRLNPFINVATYDAKGLEKLGNTLLAPVHFILDGRVAIYHDQKEYELKPRFDYQKNLSLYGPLSVSVFTPCLILGILFKGLSFLEKEVAKKYEKIEGIIYGSSIQSNLAYYTSVGIPIIAKEEAKWLTPLGYKRKKEVTPALKAMQGGLKAVISILEQQKIPYWIDCGTLLGAYRYGGLIPWDTDIDIAILFPDFENVRRALNRLDPEKYVCQDWSNRGRPSTYLRVYVKEIHDHIDIYCFKIQEKEKTVQGILSHEISKFYPKKWIEWELRFCAVHPLERVFPLKRAYLEDLEVWVPNDTVSYLQCPYGKNLRPTMLFNEETGEYEKDLTHAYWQRKAEN